MQRFLSYLFVIVVLFACISCLSAQLGSFTPTNNPRFTCGNGVVEPGEECDPGIKSQGGFYHTCCNGLCRWKHKGLQCSWRGSTCLTKPRCDLKRGLQPVKCIPGHPKRKNTGCLLIGGGTGRCDGFGVCMAVQGQGANQIN